MAAKEVLSTDQPQTNVTLFGLIDIGIDVENGGQGSVTRVQSGQQYGSRWGLRGGTDFGGGNSAYFVIEAGINVDNGTFTKFGTNTSAGDETVYTRQVSFGLRNTEMGALQLGRQYSLTDGVKGAVEPFENGTAADTSPLRALDPSRHDNAIRYMTPTFGGGFVGSLMYSVGTEEPQTATTSNDAGKSSAVSLVYSGGPLYVGAAYTTINNRDALTALRTEVQEAKAWIIGATYNFGVVKLHGWLNGLDADAVGSGADLIAARDLSSVMLGLTVPVSATSDVRVSYAKRDDGTADDKDASLWGVGYFKKLYPNLTLYTAYARLTNEDRFTGGGAVNGAGLRLGNGANSTPALVNNNYDPKGFNIGVRYVF
jgi:predicted porin